MSSIPELTPEQKADAARLMAIYRQWKADERAQGRTGTQEVAADALGMSQSAFSQYCRGARPLNVEVLVKMRNLFGWDPHTISPSLSKKMVQAAAASGGIDIEAHAPVHMVDAKASAGKGQIVFSQDVTKILMFRRDWLTRHDAKPETTIAFQVDGNSMIDMHIIDGSVVLANRRRTEPISKRVYVVWINGRLYVKQLIKKDGVWWARSHNAVEADEYPDIQIDDPDSRVVGRAFWCGFGL
jgi:phage repressor protein C with HTH and peptisase S24 domain